MPTDIQQLKKIANNNIDLVFSGLGIEYEEINGTLYSNCPVHAGSDNPRGFSYNPQRGTWKCWTRNCNEDYTPDIIGLVRGILSREEGSEVGFGETLRWFYRVLNLDHRDIKENIRKVNNTEDAFSTLVRQFNTEIKYKDEVEAKDWERSIPSEYFLARSFKKETLNEFQVGDCYNKSCPMRYRSVIPVHNENGLLVGSIGRAIYDYMEPKFMIESGFDKRFYLYNHHRAKETAIRTSCMFLVEGQGDVWRLWEAGVKNVVGLFGKEITQAQEDKLAKMGVTRLIVLFDHDQAGREAKITINRNLSRLYKLYFPNIPTRRDIGETDPEVIIEKILCNLKGLY